MSVALVSKEYLIGMAWASSISVDEAAEFLTDNGHLLSRSEIIEQWVKLDEGSGRTTLARV
jgi:hypothetical protein